MNTYTFAAYWPHNDSWEELDVEAPTAEAAWQAARRILEDDYIPGYTRLMRVSPTGATCVVVRP